jgi:undecaprenyl pyrophosphate synthase
MVEIFSDNVRIALHRRNRKKYDYSTEDDHMPANHQFINGWNTDRFIKWASKMGGSIETFIELLLESKQHPQQAFKACMGVLKLGKKYKEEDLEKVCENAIKYNAISYRFISNSLKNNIHKMEQENPVDLKLPLHKNIRGKDNYK